MSTELPPEHDEDAVTAAFASFKSDAARSFPPPSVDDLIMSGPAKLRRRRLVSLAAVLGACTAVTAGGFAVAQTLGPLTGGSDPQGPGAGSQSLSSEEESATTQLGDPAAPESEQDAPTTETSAAPTEGSSVLTIEAPEGDWAEKCVPGEFDIDLGSWEIEGESGWTSGEAVTGDVDADGADDAVLALTCDGKTGVAAFAFEATGEDAENGDAQSLHQLGWVWEPDGSQELSEISSVEAGVITLAGLSGATETWTARYEWDGGAFVEINDEPTTEPSPSESSETPGPDETQSTEASPTITDEEPS
ncbi:hypothetical protein [Glycomyces buryatensis]|uniref:Uncharacterized protein n=1 Tax=Glycomyces buryatensis TaxID=2570927 RepID=A0A4S8QDZ9_9ACTN|nr:hypothetical protein [Glycomyces buryatensis]THV41135.1 hypothetical protein FAB82_13320 [Glycomyces buryatensis]